MESKCRIIGNGFIAQSFKNFFNTYNIIIFASGVSNSSNLDNSEFEKEIRKLKDIKNNSQDSKLIYFSSCSIEDGSRNKKPYQIHKKKMETIINQSFENYLIFRLPEIVGNNKNPYTLFNFLVNKIKNKQKILTSSKCYRNLIDIDDVKLIIKSILEKNINRQVINVANLKMQKVIDIVKIMSKILNYDFIIEENERFDNEDFIINVDTIAKINKHLKINFDENYINLLLKKYINNV